MAMQCQHCVTQASRYSENGERVALRPVQKYCAMQQRARAQWMRGGHRAAKASASSMGQTTAITRKCTLQEHILTIHARTRLICLLCTVRIQRRNRNGFKRMRVVACKPHRSCSNTAQNSNPHPNNASTVHATPHYIPTPTSNALANTHVLLYSRLAAHIDR